MTFSSPVLALVGDTFRESLSRKIFWGFLGCSTVLILLFLLVLNIDLVEGGVAAVEVFSMEVNQGRTVPVEELVGFVLGAVASFLFTAGLFLAIFAAAGLIPTVFEPGRIELLLSKPVSRPTLLLAKVLGTLAVIGVNLFYLVLGVWIILGFKTEIWKTDFLLAAVLAMFAFAVLLPVIVFVAVVSDSAVLATMVTYFVALMSLIFSQHERIAPYFDSQWPRDLVEGLYHVFPKLYEIGNTARLVLMERELESWMPIWSSGIFAVVVLGAGVWVFQRKDY